MMTYLEYAELTDAIYEDPVDALVAFVTWEEEYLRFDGVADRLRWIADNHPERLADLHHLDIRNLMREVDCLRD